MESYLREALHEHLNAEIVLGTVNSASAGLAWLKHSFLFVRMCAAPARYGLPSGTPPGPGPALDGRLEDLLMRTLRELAAAGMCTVSQDGSCMAAAEPGLLMARYCIRRGGPKSHARCSLLICSSTSCPMTPATERLRCILR